MTVNRIRVVVLGSARCGKSGKNNLRKTLKLLLAGDLCAWNAWFPGYTIFETLVEFGFNDLSIIMAFLLF